MYCILSKEPISNFFASEDQRGYIDSKDFFAVQGLITKKNLYDKIAGWVNYYSLFEKVPCYLAVMTDNYYFSHTQKTSHSIFMTIKWDNLPDEKLPFEKQKKYVLPKEQRLWELGYFMGIYQMIKTHNFRIQPFYEIKLTGDNNYE
jgi:hypothetical protein